MGRGGQFISCCLGTVRKQQKRGRPRRRDLFYGGINIMSIESWRIVDGTQDSYEVSSIGEVRRIGKTVNLTPTVLSDGSLRVGLSVKGEPSGISVARAVLTAFVGPSPFGDGRKSKVVFKNSDKADCSVENLEWAPKGNSISAYPKCAAGKEEDFSERFDDESCPNKVMIENMLYDFAARVGKIKGSMLCITGPNVQRHIHNAFHYIATGKTDRMVIAELRPSRFANIEKVCRDNSKIDILRMDVRDLHNSYTFEDVDLMGTLKCEAELHKERITRQGATIDGPKGYIFTSSFRNGDGEEKAIDHINDILSTIGGQITGFGGVAGGFSKIVFNLAKKGYILQQTPDVVESGRLSHFQAIKYADKGDMLTGLIIYE